MNELNGLLNNIGYTLWFFDMISLCVFFRIAKEYRKMNSDLITMLVVFVFSSLTIGYQESMNRYDLMYPGSSLSFNYWWYTGFTVFSILGMIALKEAHEFANVQLDKYGLYVNRSFLILGCLQMAMLTEIAAFNSDAYMGNIYTVGISTINIATTLICIIVAIKAIGFTEILKRIKG